MGLNLQHKKIEQPIFGEHVTFVLREMCSRVGVKYEKIPFNDRFWFTLYEWDKEQESEFSKWLSDYLYSNVKARRELTGMSYKTKKRCKNAADTFTSWFGWKTKKQL